MAHSWREVKPKKTIKSISLQILEDLLCIMLDLPEAFLSKKAAYKIAYGYQHDGMFSSEVSKLFYRLKKSGYIEEKMIDNNESIILTNKTKIKLLEVVAKKYSNDDRYRFVSFDIPERMRAQRNQFRRSIKKLGFRQIQKSLWVCNKDIGEMVELLSYEYGVENYVAYIMSECSNIDGLIEKKLSQQKNKGKTLQTKQ